jgi:hypothetical protein
MGSSSRSNSDQQTNNSSISQAAQGDLNGVMLNGNNNTVTDGGAFKIIGDLVDQLPMFFSQGSGMVSDGFNAVTDVAMMGERQNENAFNTALDLYGEASNAQQQMFEVGSQVLTESGRNQLRATEESFNFGRDAMDMAGRATDTAINANERITLAAMDGNTDLTGLIAGALENANNNSSDLAALSMTNNTSFARDALDSTTEAQRDATGQLVEGYDMMLDSFNSFSRSDGAALAESNNKTLLMLFGGAAVTVVVVAVIATRSKK